MLQQQVQLLTTVLMVLDALVVIVAGYATSLINWDVTGDWIMENEIFIGSILAVMFVNNYMLGRFGLYGDRRPSSHARLIASVLKATVISFGALAVILFLSYSQEYSRHVFGAFGLLSFAGVCIVRILFRVFLDRVSKNDPYSRKILVVGNAERGRYVAELLKQQLSLGHEVLGIVALEPGDGGTCATISSCADLEKIVREKTVDEVVFAASGDRATHLGQYLNFCKRTGIACRILPAMWAPNETALGIEKCQDVPFLTLRTNSFNATGLIYKRALDILGGLVGCLIFAVIYPFVAAAIRLDSPGPAIFRQKRVGKHGRVFELLKFRTMHNDAEHRLKEVMAANEMNGAMFKLNNDPRITRAGRWLRRTSVDEIPQFWNVLIGEMSLVGTRPPTLDEVKTYKLDHLKRIAVKPGLTGMWQVSGRNKVKDFETVVKLDCRYMETWRFSTDLKILVQTIWVVLLRKGAI